MHYAAHIEAGIVEVSVMIKTWFPDNHLPKKIHYNNKTYTIFAHY